MVGGRGEGIQAHGGGRGKRIEAVVEGDEHNRLSTRARCELSCIVNI